MSARESPGLFVRVPIRVVGLVMGFGVGVLISAVAFELTGAAGRTAAGSAESP